jgi:hypothetical protein
MADIKIPWFGGYGYMKVWGYGGLGKMITRLSKHWPILHYHPFQTTLTLFSYIFSKMYLWITMCITCV